jgi:3-carboxy-cis,cis-muconate cycloisomerase
MMDNSISGLGSGAQDVARALSGHARLQAMLDVEAALADAEASIGLIPRSAATAIGTAAARAELYDFATIADQAVQAGNLAIPLIRELTRQVASTDPEAARYVHWGATSQDIIDTGFVLQLRAAVPLVRIDLRRAAAAAAGHARRHADTLMPGRTWLQHATPTTFGLKAAGWFDALTRAHDALGSSLEEALVIQFGGASGTLAALGSRGPAVAAALGARLRLAVPALPWHAHRGRLARLACDLGVAAGTLGKVARDLTLLAQTEVGEAHEPAADAGGSSTMPHKRNPVRAAAVLAAAVRAPGLVATILSAMPQEHERGVGGWQAEWETLPELLTVTASAARAAADALEALVVNPARMRANLDATGGLAMAEAITMRLATHVGKAEAHAIVEAACRRAIAETRRLADVLAEDASVVNVIDQEDLERTLSPEGYLGAAKTFIVNALARKEERSNDA